jgi:hypothetical protein
MTVCDTSSLIGTYAGVRAHPREQKSSYTVDNLAERHEVSLACKSHLSFPPSGVVVGCGE